MKYPFIWLIRFYRRFISPCKRPCCRFTPTCSAYALEAFTKRGFFVGFGLTVRRILRCNPLGGQGYDPVPEGKKRWARIDRGRMGKQRRTELGISDADVRTSDTRVGSHNNEHKDGN